MRYLNKFSLVNENVEQAKALLKKIKISESDPDFIKIREMLKGHEGYVYWFTKLRFEDNQPVDELKNIWDIINDGNGLTNYFTKKVVELDSVESFWDQYERAKLFSGAKKVLNQFPANQKKLFKLDNEDDFNLLVSLSRSKSLPALIRKISSFRDKNTLVAAAQRLLTSSFDGKFGELLKLVDSVDADIKVADEENNIIICGVNYEQIRKLGGDTSWCIVRAESTFNSYAVGGFQWVIFLVDNFGKNDKMSKIGFTTHFGYTTAHDKYDGYVAKDQLTKILFERGVDISDFYISRENLQLMSNWDLVSVEILLDKKFLKPEIIKKKNVFKDKNKYQRQTVSKSDIEYFTEDEIKKWDLEEKVEVTWSYISKLDKKSIIERDLLNRLDQQIYITNLVNSLNFTKEDILENELYKYSKILVQASDLFDQNSLLKITKEDIIKYDIINYVNYGVYLDVLFRNGFTKDEIIKLGYYKSNKILINAESLSYFNKSELIKYGIIDKANNIPFNILFATGFSKNEIIKNYSSILDETTRRVIKFFEGKTKAGVKKRLCETFWSDDEKALGIERNYIYKVKLIAMSIYDINFDTVGMKGLKSIFGSDKLSIEKSSLDTLYSLGFKITDEESFYVISSLFESRYNSNTLPKLTSILKFKKLFKKDDISYGLCSKLLDNVLKSDNVYFNYFEFMEHKGDLVGPDYDKIIKELKKSKLGRYGWDIKTKSSKDTSSWDTDFDNTAAFMKELRFTKEDIETMSIENFANIFEQDGGRYSSSSFDNIDKVIKLLKDYGFTITEQDQIRIIRGVIRGSVQSNSKGDDGKNIVVYSEDYHKQLIKKGFRLDDSLEWLFKYFKKKDSLSEYQEGEYLAYFKKGGKEWIKKFQKEVKVIKHKELYFKCTKDLQKVFERPATYSSREGKITAEQWYNEYFDMYNDIDGKFHGYSKSENDIKVIWLLASLNKLDEVDTFYDWNRVNSNTSSGFSFDKNMLHSIAKLLCRIDSKYDRDFMHVVLSDEQIKSLYELVLKNVDESKYWVKKNLIVCYYLYDKSKFDKFVNELLTMKNNYEFNKYDRQGEFKELGSKTFRIDGLKYILKYLARLNKTEEIEALIDKLIVYRTPSTPRANKMTNPEFESTLKFISYLSSTNNNGLEFRIWRDNYIRNLQNKFSVVKESFIIKWSDFNIK